MNNDAGERENIFKHIYQEWQEINDLVSQYEKEILQYKTKYQCSCGMSFFNANDQKIRYEKHISNCYRY